VKTLDTEPETEEDVWARYKEDAEQNRKDLITAIQNRKAELICWIEEYADDLTNQADRLCASHLEAALQKRSNPRKSATEKVKQENGGRRSSKGNSACSSPTGSRKSDYIVDDVEDVEEELSVEKTFEPLPTWDNIELIPGTGTDYVLQHLFGEIQTNASLSVCHNVCLKDTLSLTSSFMTKTKFDDFPCGLSDVTVTANGETVVVDKDNKLVKMFDINGKLKQIIGSGVLKQPCRVLASYVTPKLYISDALLQKVCVFSQAGQYLKDFVSHLGCPTSLAETKGGEIVIVEYKTSTAVIFDKDGMQLYQFQIQTPTPAYITCGPNNEIVVTDWKTNVIQGYSITGHKLWTFQKDTAKAAKSLEPDEASKKARPTSAVSRMSVSSTASGDAECPLKQPQGPCVDSYGHIFVSDSKNHRILVLNNNGGLKTILMPKDKGLKLPMAITCNRKTGQLCVAEYQGHVKCFDYLQHEDQSELELRLTDAEDALNLDPDQLSITSKDSEKETVI